MISRQKPISKTIVVAVIMALAFTTVNLRPRQAQAVVGAVGNPAMLATGLALGIIGLTTIGTAGNPYDKGSRSAFANVLGALAVAAGLVLLDDGSQAGLKFVPVDAARALQIGMTAAERDAFNDSVDEINAVAETIAGELAQDQHPSAELAHARWEAYAADLSAESAVGAQKVAAAFLKQAEL